MLGRASVSCRNTCAGFRGVQADDVHVLMGAACLPAADPLAACRNHQGCSEHEKDGLTISQKNCSLIAPWGTENAGQIRNNKDCVASGTRNNDRKIGGTGASS
jgi:hypothetical protein